MNDLKTLLRQEVDGVKQIEAWGRNQSWGYVDKDHVSFCALEYEIVPIPPANPLHNNVAARLLFQNLVERVDLEGPYETRQTHCLVIDRILLKAGYVLTHCLVHQHAHGDMVRAEYFRVPTGTEHASTLRVVYMPTEFTPKVVAMAGEIELQYQTPGYDHGTLNYIGTAGFDGRPYRSITIERVQDDNIVWMPLPNRMTDDLYEIDIDEVYSRTHSESNEGWKREYLAKLSPYCGVEYMVNVTVKNYHQAN